MNVVVFGTDPQNRNQYIVQSVAAAFAAHAGVSRVFRPGYLELVGVCQEHRIDLLVAIGGAGAIAAPLVRAARASAHALLWASEDPYELAANVRLSEEFDSVMTNDAAALPHYAGRAAHLPFAGSELVHDVGAVRGADQLLFDLFFVGTAWPERVSELDQLLAALPAGLRRKIGLSGNPHLPGFRLGDPGLLTDFRLAPREFARMANASAVGLTLDRRFSSGSTLGVEGATPPPRVFELALAGTAQVYLSRRAGIADYFAVDEEIVVVRDVPEAVAAVRSLLAEPDRRQRIAEAARARALSEHLYAHRVAAILAHVGLRQRRAPAATAAARKRVLIVSHNRAGIQPFGGVELYQETMIKALPDYDFSILYPQRDGSGLVLYDAAGGTSEHHPAPAPAPDAIAFAPRERIFSELLFERRFDLVHFNHLLGHPLSLPLLARAAGMPVVFQAHDFFGVCSEFNLIGMGGRYCAIQDERTTTCDICLSSRGIAPPGAQARRRLVFEALLGGVDRVFHLCEYARQKFLRIYPGVQEEKHCTLGYSGRPATLRGIAGLGGRAGREERAGRLQVAVLGNFTKPKGGDLLLAMFHQLRADPIDIHIVGRVDPDLAAGLQVPKFENVRAHGEFGQERLGVLLEHMDVSVHFSIWPETYCIAVDEAWAGGVVPIVLGYGALAERVRDGVNGIVIDPARPFALIDVLRRLAVDRAALARFDLPNIDRLIGNHDAHFARVGAVFAELIERRPVHQAPGLGAGYRPLLFGDLALRFDSTRWRDYRLDCDDDPVEAPLPPMLSAPALVAGRRYFAAAAERMSALRRRLVRRKARAHLDSIGGHPIEARAGRSFAAASLRGLEIVGWCVPPGGRPPFDGVSITLVSGDARISARAQPELRPDVGHHFGDMRLAAAGFRWVAPGTASPPGRYAIELTGWRGDTADFVARVGELDLA